MQGKICHAASVGPCSEVLISSLAPVEASFISECMPGFVRRMKGQCVTRTYWSHRRRFDRFKLNYSTAFKAKRFALRSTGKRPKLKTLLRDTPPVLRRTLRMRPQTKFIGHIFVPDQLLGGLRTEMEVGLASLFPIYALNEIKRCMASVAFQLHPL